MFALTPELKELAFLLYATGEDRKEADRKIIQLLDEVGQPYGLKIPFIWYKPGAPGECKEKRPITITAKITAFAGFQVKRPSEVLSGHYSDLPLLMGGFWIEGRENFSKVYEQFRSSKPRGIDNVWAITPGCVLAVLLTSYPRDSATTKALKAKFNLARCLKVKDFIKLYEMHFDRRFPLEPRSTRGADHLTSASGDIPTSKPDIENIAASTKTVTWVDGEGSAPATVKFNPSNQSLDTLLRDRLVIQMARKAELEKEIEGRMDELSSIDTEIKKLRAFLEMDTPKPESNGNGNSKTLGNFVKLNKAG